MEIEKNEGRRDEQKKKKNFKLIHKIERVNIYIK